jgi:hypothetical protein
MEGREMSEANPSSAHGGPAGGGGAGRAFILAVIVLSVAAAGMQSATDAFQLHFRKRPVPLAEDALKKIPMRLGHWMAVSGEDQSLEKDIEDVLGTKQCIFREYVDTRLVGQAKLDAFAGKSWEERAKLLAEMERVDPRAVVHVGVTYYTGLADTVAHIPERCYVANGFEPNEYEVVNWDVRGEATTGRRVPGDKGMVQARFMNLDDATSATSRVTRSVAYFFQVNGHYESDPLGVRRSLQNLLERHGYYAKVELMTLVSDREQSAGIMRDFLSAALPEIEAVLPDWEAVRARSE